MIIIIDNKSLEFKINSTPTSPERTALCDFKIMAEKLAVKHLQEVYIMKELTDEIVNQLNDFDYYFVSASNGWKECFRGFFIKKNVANIKSILIQQ